MKYNSNQKTRPRFTPSHATRALSCITYDNSPMLHICHVNITTLHSSSRREYFYHMSQGNAVDKDAKPHNYQNRAPVPASRGAFTTRFPFLHEPNRNIVLVIGVQPKDADPDAPIPTPPASVGSGPPTPPPSPVGVGGGSPGVAVNVDTVTYSMTRTEQELEDVKGTPENDTGATSVIEGLGSVDDSKPPGSCGAVETGKNGSVEDPRSSGSCGAVD